MVVEIDKILKDATIEKESLNNYGLDPILEISKDKFFIFNLKEDNLNFEQNKFLLNLTLANAKNLNIYPKLKLCLLTEDWVEEFGKTLFPKQEGANYYNSGINEWTYPNFFDSNNCLIIDYNPLETDKLIINLNDFQSIFNANNLNIEFGFILKLDETIENNFEGELYFYGKDTETIFYPKLIKIPLENYNILNVNFVKDEYFDIISYKLQKEYYKSVQRFKFLAKPQVNRIDFNNEFTYLYSNFLLPINTTFQLKDMYTGDIIIPYESYKLNNDKNCNYVDIDLRNLSENRFYSINIKTILGSKEKYSKEFVFYLR